MKTKCTIDHVRNAVKAVFRVDLAALSKPADLALAECIVLPEDDRGEWAPAGSIAVIYHEMGYLPSGDYHARDGMGQWFRVSDRLPGAFVEYVNAAVSVVYPT